MAVRRSSTRRIVVKGPAARKEALEKKRAKSASRRKTSRTEPKRKTKTKPRAKEKTAKTRRTSRTVQKKKTTRRTSRSVPKRKVASRSGSSGRAKTVLEQDAIADTHALLSEWGFPGWDVEFVNRMNPIGRCSYADKRITYSREWWTVMTEAERKRTIIHETAHAIAGPGTGHGREWKDQMRRMGIRDPRAKSTIANAADVARFSNTHVAIRCCGRSHRMTIRKFHSWNQKRARCRCPGGMPSTAPELLSTEDELKYANYLKSKRLVANRLRVNKCGC
jgi:predicted SprT family Zn-dependent metalloprotease